MSKKHRRKQQKKKIQESSKKQENNSVIREVATYAIIIVIAVILAAHLNVVVSGSMEPTFYRGDIVATQGTNVYGIQEFNPEKDVNVGDIVIYNAQWYPEPVIHRVINVTNVNGSKWFVIKGDNNKQQDPYLVSPSQVTGKVINIGNFPVVIPKIGYITLWFRGL